MSTLFNISSRYADIIEKIDSFADWDPDTDADGNFITPDGEVIDDPVEYRQTVFLRELDLRTDLGAASAERAAPHVQRGDAVAHRETTGTGTRLGGLCEFPGGQRGIEFRTPLERGRQLRPRLRRESSRTVSLFETGQNGFEYHQRSTPQ